MNVKSDGQIDEVVITLTKREAEALALLLGAIPSNEVVQILSYYNKSRKGKYPKPLQLEERYIFNDLFFKMTDEKNLNWYSDLTNGK